MFTNYSKGLSVPSTDNLYNSFFFPLIADAAHPKPEVTDSFDGGLRYRRANIQAQISGWYTHFTNRQASSFDPELNVSVFRNLGTVNKWGIDGSIAYEPIRELTLYAFGSWNKSKIQDNIQVGALPAARPATTSILPAPWRSEAAPSPRAIANPARRNTRTASRRSGELGPVTLGVEAKRTGPRFIFDNNAAVFRGDVDCPGTVALGCPSRLGGDASRSSAETAPAYWLVNLDARVELEAFSRRAQADLPAAQRLQPVRQILRRRVRRRTQPIESCASVAVGGCPDLAPASGVWGNPPFVQIGAPRTVSASINVQF